MLVETRTVGELSEFHSVLECWFTTEDRFFGRTADRYDVDVEFWCEPPVEPQLLFAEETALLQRREIQERQPYGLFELVCKFPG